MISVALDTATDRCSVAAGDGIRVAHRHLDGARRHAAAILQLLEEALQDLGTTSRQIDRVVSADGPGSFTGLRVVATVAKALTWRRSTTWYTTPSLLVRAFGHAPAGGGRVLALSDALRGELYAGCWAIDPVRGITAVEGPPRAMRPDELDRFGVPDVVVGSMPAALREAVIAATGREPVEGAEALPDARHLLALVDRPGGTVSVIDPVAWEPEYGRPAEAQAVWERKHGRALPDTPYIPR